MATKTFRARIVNSDQQLRNALERTNHFFVDCLSQMVQRYIQMKKGRCGPECAQLAEILLSRSNTFAHGVMDQLTRKTCTSKVESDWTTLAKAYHKTNGPLFLQHECFATVDGIRIHTKPNGKIEPTSDSLAVPAKFWHQVCDKASAFLKSNQELHKQWRKEKEDWLKERSLWRESHPEFLIFYEGVYKEFEQLCEKARTEAQTAAGQLPTVSKNVKRTKGKRYDRWHLWYEWIIAHPEIVEWRGRASRADFKTLSSEEQQQIKAKLKRQDKYVGKCLEWLKENNSELKELDNLRRRYVRDFETFKRPPTLTLPSKTHPEWFTLELNEFYRRPDFENGMVQLQLIDQTEKGELYFRWFDCQILCDWRLKPSERKKVFEADGQYPPYMNQGDSTASSRDDKVGRSLDKPALEAKERKAGYAGAKLYFKQGRHELLFTIIEQDCPPLIKWKKTADRKCAADNAFSPDDSRIPLKVMAIDLGIRHIGAYSVVAGSRQDGGWQVEWIKKGILHEDTAPDLTAIRRHDREIRKLKSRLGKAPRGQRSFKTLQDHRTKMAEDRFKKAANQIVQLARHENVHLILFEKLDTLNPTAFDERWLNRQLRDMNRRNIVDFVKAQSKEFGIECKDDISPWLTSHLCSKCGRPGWRFSIKSKQPFAEKERRCDCRQYGYPIWDSGGHLFHCPHCGYKLNSDINASGNIAARFFQPKSELSRKDWVYTWPENGKTITFDARKTFEKWANEAVLRKKCVETPF